MDAYDCKIFVKDLINDVNKILKRFEEVDLTLSINKSKFGFDEIIIVERSCGRYEKKSNPKKVDAIAKMIASSRIIEIRRFLGGCVFYEIWIPHFAHMTEPLYKFLRKETKI